MHRKMMIGLMVLVVLCVTSHTLQSQTLVQFEQVKTTGNVGFNLVTREVTAKSGQSFTCYQVQRDLYMVGSLSNDDIVPIILDKGINEFDEWFLVVDGLLGAEIDQLGVTLLSKRPKTMFGCTGS